VGDYEIEILGKQTNVELSQDEVRVLRGETMIVHIKKIPAPKKDAAAAIEVGGGAEPVPSAKRAPAHQPQDSAFLAFFRNGGWQHWYVRPIEAMADSGVAMAHSGATVRGAAIQGKVSGDLEFSYTFRGTREQGSELLGRLMGELASIAKDRGAAIVRPSQQDEREDVGRIGFSFDYDAIEEQGARKDGRVRVYFDDLKPADDDLDAQRGYIYLAIAEEAPDPTTASAQLRLFRQLEGNSQAVQAIELTPDGSRLISAGAGEILVRDTTTWDVVQTLKTERLRTRAIAIGSRADRLATGGQDGWLEIWDLESGQRLAQHDLGQGWIEYMDWSPDGKSIVLKCRDAGGYLVWDAATRQIVRSFEESGQAFVFSPEGKWLAAGERLHGAVKIFDAATGRVRLRLVHHTRKDRVRALAFSPDGRIVLTGADDGDAKLWDAETGDLLETFRHDGGVHAAVFLPDSRRFVTGSKETRSLHLWSLTGRLLGGASDVEVGERGMATTPDGRHIITALPHFQLPAGPGVPGMIQIWQLPESGESPECYGNSPRASLASATRWTPSITAAVRMSSLSRWERTRVRWKASVITSCSRWLICSSVQL
jgi:WD40 repeat protein